MRAIRAVLLVAAALFAAVHADGGVSSVLDGTAASLSTGSETTSSSTTAPTATTANDLSSDTTSLASSSDEETTEAPQTDGSSSSSSSESTSPATVVPSDASSASNSASSSSSPSATTSTPTTTSASSSSLSAASSSDHVGALTDVTSSISNTTGGALSTSGFIGIAFGALACVGAIVLIVTYKKKGDRDSENQQRPPSSCAYADGNAFTPDSRSLDAILDVDKPQSSGQQQQQPNEKLLPVLSMADLTSSSATRASSPFGMNSKAVRVSSPVRQFSSNCSDDDMVFATSSRRQNDGSDVVLTFADMERESSASTVAAIEDGRGQVLL